MSTENKDTHKIFSHDTAVTIFMMVVMDCAFLILFYFLYILKKEKEIIAHDLHELIFSLGKDIKLLPREYKDALKKMAENMKTADSTELDAKIIESNAKIFKQTMIIVIVFLFISTLIIFAYAYKFEVRIFKIFIINLVLLSAIFATELFFVNNISSKYVGIDPNVIKKIIFQQLL